MHVCICVSPNSLVFEQHFTHSVDHCFHQYIELFIRITTKKLFHDFIIFYLGDKDFWHLTHFKHLQPKGNQPHRDYTIKGRATAWRWPQIRKLAVIPQASRCHASSRALPALLHQPRCRIVELPSQRCHATDAASPTPSTAAMPPASRCCTVEPLHRRPCIGNPALCTATPPVLHHRRFGKLRWPRAAGGTRRS